MIRIFTKLVKETIICQLKEKYSEESRKIKSGKK